MLNWTKRIEKMKREMEEEEEEEIKMNKKENLIDKLIHEFSKLKEDWTWPMTYKARQ